MAHRNKPQAICAVGKAGEITPTHRNVRAAVCGVVAVKYSVVAMLCALRVGKGVVAAWWR